MKVFWIILKVLGMLFVGLTCYNSILHISAADAITSLKWPLFLVLALSALFLYWAYRVIWKPIGSK
jgi:hypothetical protein